MAATLASVMWPHLREQFRASRWPAAPAEIISSQFVVKSVTGEQRYETAVTYRYTYAGQTYTSDRFRVNGNPSSSDASEAQRLVNQYSPGAARTCYVNPQNPAVAVLDNSVSYWMLIMLPGPFFIWVILDWRRISEWREGRRQPQGAERLRPLTANRELKRVGLSNLFIGICSLIMSCLLGGWAWMWPLWRTWQQTRHWKETSCLVVETNIRKDNNYHGVSFQTEVQFEYEYGGRKLVGSRLDLSDNTGASVVEAERRLKGVHPGPAHCFVNPSDPTQAVLRRTCYIDRFFGPFTMLWMVGSLGMVLAAGHSLRKRSRPTPQVVPATLTLKQPPPALSLAGCLVAGLVCAAGAAWIGWLCWENYQRGVFEFLQALYVFMLGSGAFACFGFAWKGWLACLAPPPQMKLTPGNIKLGAPIEIGWCFTDHKRPHRVRFWLEGREEAKVLKWVSHGHGQMKQETDERAVFARLPVAEVESIETMREGSKQIVMPAAAMHSFDGQKSKIRWVLHAERCSPQGKPVDYEFPVEVRPYTAQAA
jgi:hypothetical protein